MNTHITQYKLYQNKVNGSSQASGCVAEWVGGIFCLHDAAWMELIPLERGKVRTVAGRECFPLSHENSIAVPAAQLFRSLPPNQTVILTHDPGMLPLGAGQRLACHFKTPLSTIILSISVAFHSHTNTAPPPFRAQGNPRRHSPVQLLLLNHCFG